MYTLLFFVSIYIQHFLSIVNIEVNIKNSCMHKLGLDPMGELSSTPERLLACTLAGISTRKTQCQIERFRQSLGKEHFRIFSCFAWRATPIEGSCLLGFPPQPKTSGT